MEFYQGYLFLVQPEKPLNLSYAPDVTALYTKWNHMAMFKTESVSAKYESYIKAALQTAAECKMCSVVNMAKLKVMPYFWVHDFQLVGVPHETLFAANPRNLTL